MTTQWGWHYRKSLKKDTWIRRAGIGWCQLKDLHCLDAVAHGGNHGNSEWGGAVWGTCVRTL
ncbi:hypothetical protein BJP36_40320 [Moorena producens JHB]|uniref:Uncharacterized protein n=1 Tax=Moorena producens (strain JHB) TaxID=1454205 RepID=A0A9Q9SS27_MOOP1|nr:hypothetical protein [Moorena producens]WAN68620.1 hypothetical protein BJP36_40320 [Moorena producens JHB]